VSQNHTCEILRELATWRLAVDHNGLANFSMPSQMLLDAASECLCEWVLTNEVIKYRRANK
jgi:hypothetical protein